MDSAAFSGDENLTLTFSTWVAALQALGVPGVDGPISAAAAAVIDDAEGAQALVRAVSEALPIGSGPDKVREVAASLYGRRTTSALGEGDRAQRLSAIRKYQFGSHLPWLARIWERNEEGAVTPSWLLIEQVTDQVLVMDHNPWNDIDEERAISVGDFQVLWELDGCTAVSLG